MYSLANRCSHWIASILLPLILLFLVVTLSACGSDKRFTPPDPIKDTTAPSIMSSFPNELASTDFEVDYAVEILFSERMNLSSLSTEGGVKLYSGKLDENNQEDQGNVDSELSLRDAVLTFSEVPVTTEDPITEKQIQLPATKLVLRHASGRFALNTAYTVFVESPARDLVEDDLKTPEDDRNYIQGVNPIDFITQKGSWKTTQALPNLRIETAIDSSETAVEVTDQQINPKVISNTQGDTFALWLQEGSIAGVNQLWISRYLVNEKKWTLFDATKEVCLVTDATKCANSERIDSNDVTSVFDYQAAVNRNGQIVVVWSQAAQAGGYVAIYARIYNGTEWLSATEISSSGLSNQAGDADSPRVVMDQNGNIVAIWREDTGTKTRIKTNIYNALSGAWTEAPSFVDNDTGSATQTPDLAISQSGRVIAVWAQNQSGRYRIFSSRIRLGQSINWQTPVQIDEINPSSVEFAVGHSSKPKVAIDKNGDAIAVWLKFDGIRNNVWYNRFTGNWGTEALLLEGDRRGDADSPEIIISQDSKAMALWTQRVNSSNITELKARIFVASTSWQNEKTITNSSSIHKPVARFDREGNVNVIWQEGSSKGRLVTSYYSKLTDSWNQAESFIETSNANNVSLVPLYEDGRFLSVWETIEGLTRNLSFRRFSD